MMVELVGLWYRNRFSIGGEKTSECKKLIEKCDYAKKTCKISKYLYKFDAHF